MLLVDTEKKCFIQDVELKKQISNSRPHSDWLRQKVSFKYLSLILENDPDHPMMLMITYHLT